MGNDIRSKKNKYDLYTPAKHQLGQKKLSKYEKKIMFNEKNYLGEDFYKNYSSRDVYIEQKKFLELKCKKNGINFKDSNEWFNEFKENDEIFNDSSHLTDYGNEILSKNTQKFLV